MAVYPVINIYIDLDNDGVPETNISDKVVTDINGGHGIFGFSDTERLPSIGTISFDINNEDGSYTIGGAFIGKNVRVSISYAGIEKNALFGSVTDFSIDSGEWGDKRVHVTVSDWFNVANKTTANKLQLSTFLRADEALTTLLNVVPNTPLYKSFDVGTEIFPNLFDGGSNTTKIYSELDKLSKSELGYTYLKFREQIDGSTLRMENKLARGSTRSLDSIPFNATGGYLKYHGNTGTEGRLKFRGNGETGVIKITSSEDANFNAEHVEADWTSGENVINDFSISIIPRTTDTSDVILYTLGSAIEIGTQEKISLHGTFADPEGGQFIQVASIVTPIANTDYFLNTLEDGSGTNITASLFFAFAYTATGFNLTIKNNTVPGFFRLQIRGKGIYKYSPIFYNIESVESKEVFVRTEISDMMTREYSNDLRTSQLFANRVVAVNRYPNNTLKSVSFVANTNEKLLMAFMFLEQGSKIQITETIPAHTGKYYIQGIEFSLQLNKIIYFTWYLKEAVETICEPIAVRGAEATLINAIDFGILPHLSNMPAYSYSFWTKSSNGAHYQYGFPVDRTTDDGLGRRGNGVLLVSGAVYFYSFKTPTDGEWRTEFAAVDKINWHHIVVAYDNTGLAGPIIYIDGVSQSLTVLSTPAGTSDDDSDCSLVLFARGRNPLADPYEEYNIDNNSMSLKDVRIYNRILLPSEITELYANEDDYSTVQDGLVFNGIYIPSSNRNDYIDNTITSEDLILETVYGATGIPYNEDTTSDNYILRGLNI